MISNTLTLKDLHRMPIGEIAALPADQLALLQVEADEALRAAKATRDWLKGALPSATPIATSPCAGTPARTPAPSASMTGR